MTDLDEFLSRSGIDFRSLEQWVDREWLLAERRSTTIILSDMDAARARLIHDLQRDFGVNDEGIDIVLHLVDQLHDLRQVLVQMRAEVRSDQRRQIRRARGRKQGRLLGSRRPP